MKKETHRFLIRDEHGILIDCRMKRLTFGVKCSLFLATQVLQDFYVDDLLSGANTVEEADQFRRQLCKPLSQAGLNLTKWRINSEEF